MGPQCLPQVHLSQLTSQFQQLPTSQCWSHLKPGQRCCHSSHPPYCPHCEADRPHSFPCCSPRLIASTHPHSPCCEASGDPRQPCSNPLHPPCHPRLAHCQAGGARTHLPLWYRPPWKTIHCLQQGG